MFIALFIIFIIILQFIFLNGPTTVLILFFFMSLSSSYSTIYIFQSLFQLTITCFFVWIISDPDWASITIGVFLCQICAGVHRSLASRSRVKSVRLDNWDRDQVQVNRVVHWCLGEQNLLLWGRELHMFVIINHMDNIKKKLMMYLCYLTRILRTSCMFDQWGLKKKRKKYPSAMKNDFSKVACYFNYLISR